MVVGWFPGSSGEISPGVCASFTVCCYFQSRKRKATLRINGAQMATVNQEVVKKYRIKTNYQIVGLFMEKQKNGATIHHLICIYAADVDESLLQNKEKTEDLDKTHTAEAIRQQLSDSASKLLNTLMALGVDINKEISRNFPAAIRD